MHHTMSESPSTPVESEESGLLPVILLLVLSVALNAAIGVCFLKLYRWDAERTSLREENAQGGLFVQWKLRNGDIVREPPTLWEMVAGAHPIELNIGSAWECEDMEQLQRLGAIFAHHGTLEELHIYSGRNLALDAFMKHLGAQPQLRSFSCRYLGFSDEAGTFFEDCPAVEEITIESAEFTGEKFPLLPALQNIEASFPGITPTGLRRIMTCPSLREVRVFPIDQVPTEMLQAYRDLKKAYPSIELYGLGD